MEIKSLKLFKEHSIAEIISDNQNLVTKDTISRQCFNIVDGKCILKHNHVYYYQVQMQLLVTERKFCDFILYAQEGPVSIERVCRDESVITEILTFLTVFWTRVIAPEYFEMRVPRGLHPFILSEDKAVGHAPDISSHTPDELDIAVLLVNTLPVTPTASPISNIHINNLVVVPWGGVTSSGIKLTNTCPLDNLLMIFQALVKSNCINLGNLTETGHIIKDALQMIDNNQCADAKVAVLPFAPQIIAKCINFYGNEDDFFIQHLRPYLRSTVTSTCSLNTCPLLVHTSTSCTVNLGFPSQSTSHNNIFSGAIDDWLNPQVSECRRKFPCKPLNDIPSVEDVSLDENGDPQASWHCLGVRKCTERSFTNLKNFFIFSVDLISRGGMLKLSQVTQSISLNGTTYTLYGATLWNGGHYIAIFYFNNGWNLYDGMKEYLKKDSGLSFSRTMFDEPHGYTLSNLIYSI
jgi:hypothetical protein